MHPIFIGAILKFEDSFQFSSFATWYSNTMKVWNGFPFFCFLIKPQKSHVVTGRCSLVETFLKRFQQLVGASQQHLLDALNPLHPHCDWFIRIKCQIYTPVAQRMILLQTQLLLQGIWFQTIVLLYSPTDSTQHGRFNLAVQRWRFLSPFNVPRSDFHWTMVLETDVPGKAVFAEWKVEF